MGKRESSFKNMLLTLLMVTAGAGACLSGVYVMTQEKIAAAKAKKTEDAIKMVLTDFDRYEVEGIAIPNAKSPLLYKEGLPPDTLFLYKAFKGDTFVGTAVKSSSMQGFSGKVVIMVGIGVDGKLINTAVLEHKETPGLGDKMSITKSAFPEQFKGKDPQSFRLEVKQDGGDVNAITAATISSRAFCDAVQKAVDIVNKGN